MAYLVGLFLARVISSDIALLAVIRIEALSNQ